MGDENNHIYGILGKIPTGTLIHFYFQVPKFVTSEMGEISAHISETPRSLTKSLSLRSSDGPISQEPQVPFPCFGILCFNFGIMGE